MAGGVVEKPAGAYGGSTKNYLNETRGIKNWLITLDHKRIALMYLVAVTSALLLGGFLPLPCAPCCGTAPCVTRRTCFWACVSNRCTTATSHCTAQ